MGCEVWERAFERERRKREGVCGGGRMRGRGRNCRSGKKGSSNVSVQNLNESAYRSNSRRTTGMNANSAASRHGQTVESSSDSEMSTSSISRVGRSDAKKKITGAASSKSDPSSNLRSSKSSKRP